MLPKRCCQCRTFFMPKHTDLASVFCKTCIAECEKAYQRIYDYCLENVEMPLSSVVTVLGIPNLFVHHLYMNGWLVPDLARRGAGNRRLCDTCKKPLQLTERIYCDGCRVEAHKQLQKRPKAKAPASTAERKRRNPSAAKNPQARGPESSI